MKKIQPSNPFDNLILTQEEQVIESALERGFFEESSQLEDTKKMLQEAAQKYQELNTSKPITIRVNQLDLIKLKAKAKLKQIPYQTLLGALIHQYAEGQEELSL